MLNFFVHKINFTEKEMIYISNVEISIKNQSNTKYMYIYIYIFIYICVHTYFHFITYFYSRHIKYIIYKIYERVRERFSAHIEYRFSAMRYPTLHLYSLIHVHMTCTYKSRASFTFFPRPPTRIVATFWNSDTQNSCHLFPNFRSLPRPLLHLQFGKCPPDIGASPYIRGLDGERDTSKFGKLRIKLSRRRSTSEYHPPAVNWVGHNQVSQAALI